MTDLEWKEYIIKCMTSKGWVHDRDDEKTLCFSFKEGNAHWMRDYNKKNRSFVQFDGNTIVSILVTS